MKPKPSQVRKNASRKAGSSQSQSRTRARGYKKCPADETVIIQITHEDGREHVRVPFSRLEHAELKAECERRGCTMQELFIAALVAGLDKAGHLRASKKGEVAA